MILLKIVHTYQQIVPAIHRSGFITHPKPKYFGSNNINSQSFFVKLYVLNTCCNQVTLYQLLPDIQCSCTFGIANPLTVYQHYNYQFKKRVEKLTKAFYFC